MRKQVAAQQRVRLDRSDHHAHRLLIDVVLSAVRLCTRHWLVIARGMRNRRPVLLLVFVKQLRGVLRFAELCPGRLVAERREEVRSDAVQGGGADACMRLGRHIDKQASLLQAWTCFRHDTS